MLLHDSLSVSPWKVQPPSVQISKLTKTHPESHRSFLQAVLDPDGLFREKVVLSLLPHQKRRRSKAGTAFVEDSAPDEQVFSDPLRFFRRLSLGKSSKRRVSAGLLS